MAVLGTVRSWDDENAVGVVDSPETPGGCWTHYSCIAVAGHRRLKTGQRVELEWESPGQDGYPFRTVRVWPEGAEPVEPPSGSSPSSAYRSSLTLTFDEPPDDATQL